MTDATVSTAYSSVYEKKDADGTEGGTTVTASWIGTSSGSACVVAISGTDNATAAAISAKATAANSSPDPPALSPAWGAKDTLWGELIDFTSTGLISTYSANYTLAGRIAENLHGLAPAECRFRRSWNGHLNGRHLGGLDDSGTTQGGVSLLPTTAASSPHRTIPVHSLGDQNSATV